MGGASNDPSDDPPRSGPDGSQAEARDGLAARRDTGGLHTAILRILLAAALGAVGALSSCAPEPLEMRRAAAARRGIEWLVANREGMSQDWVYAIFTSLYKVAPEGDLADSIWTITEEALRTPIVELPPSLDDPRLLQSQRFRPVVGELVRRKQMGESWEEPTRQLQAPLRSHETTLWKRMQLTPQLVLLHQFAMLAVETQHSMDTVRREIRSRWQSGESERLLVDLEFMFGVTHVFFVASGYFSQYLDPRDYVSEIEMLDAALRRYLSGRIPKRRAFLDLQAEILAARKLVHLPEGEDAIAMVERLLALQHEDGSWGESFKNHEFHATYTAVLALLEYPTRLRGLPSSSERRGEDWEGADPHME